jgi:NAD(P)H-hydrate epimerase
MKYILSKEQSKNADEKAIKEYGISSIVLMENAARSTSEVIREYLPNYYEGKLYKRHIMILAGSGNNGGDGFALARHLHEDYNIYVFWIGDESKMSEDTKANYEILKKLDVFCQKIENENELNYINWNAECIVEAMIGFGGSEYLRGLIVPILQKVNSANGLKIAVDIPAGLNADTGKHHHDCFKADHTVTMFSPKTGLYLQNGPEISGHIHIAELGAPYNLIKELSNIKILEKDDIQKIIPQRNRISSKFNYGRVGVIAGSKNMSGAAALAANASIKSGAGLVELITPKIHNSILPEILTHQVDAKNGIFDHDHVEEVLEVTEKCNVIAIGPGIGNDTSSIEFMQEIYSKIPDQKIKILDADALRILSINKKCSPNTIITPHFVEFSRITSTPVKDILDSPLEKAIYAAKEMECIIVLKHVPTIITNGIETYFNIYGNPGMATAGSGDVLTGIISALSAQKIEKFHAAAFGVLIHSLAGDTYEKKYGQLTLSATNIIENLSYV